MCQHSRFWSLVSADRGERGAFLVCLTEFHWSLQTPAVHIAPHAFQLQSRSGREGGWTGTTKCFFFCKRRTRRRSSPLICCHVVERIFRRWSSEQLRRFELQEVHFKACVSAARLCGYTFVKSNPFLAIIPGFVNTKAERGVYFTTVMIEIYK